MRAGGAHFAAVCAVAVLLAAQAAGAETAADSDARFFMLLTYKEVASLNDAYQAVAMLVRGDGQVKGPAECRKMLVERKVARESWGGAPETPLTKGKLAYMVCQALGIKGGLTMRLFGPSQRYCLFELRHLELMAGGASYQHCPGGELVSVIDRADLYKQAEAEAAAGKTGETGESAEAKAKEKSKGQSAKKTSDSDPEKQVAPVPGKPAGKTADGKDRSSSAGRSSAKPAGQKAEADSGGDDAKKAGEAKH